MSYKNKKKPKILTKFSVEMTITIPIDKKKEFEIFHDFQHMINKIIEKHDLENLVYFE